MPTALKVIALTGLAAVGLYGLFYYFFLFALPQPSPKEKFEIASYVATMLGIPIGLFIFWHDRVKTRRAHEKDAFDHCNDKYIDYLKLCLEHHDTDAFEIERGNATLAAKGLAHQ